MLNATAPVHGSIKYGKKAQARKIAPSGSFDPEAARHHQRPGMSRPRAAAGSNVSFSSVPCLASTVPFPMTSPFVGRDVIFFLTQAQILSR